MLTQCRPVECFMTRVILLDLSKQFSNRLPPEVGGLLNTHCWPEMRKKLNLGSYYDKSMVDKRDLLFDA